jgi:FkbM family methyltransferase
VPLPTAVARHTDRIFGRIPLRIRGGENEGLKWSLASSGGGYRSGRRAHRQMKLLSSLLSPGDVFWDVGAHHGYMTLCGARQVGREGQVHSFEPCDRSYRFLQMHVEWNGLENVTTHQYALSSFDGLASFGGAGSSKAYSLGGGREEVKVRTADGIVGSGECPPPTVAKIDVEGAEGEMLAGAASVLPLESRLLIAVHSAEADRKCIEVLCDLGFTMIPSQGAVACRAAGWSRDPDVLWIGPECEDAAETMALAREIEF